MDERVELDDYLVEKTVNDSVRALTTNGLLLAGYPTGEDRPWYAKPLLIHVALAGTGYSSGTAVAACSRHMELGEAGEDLRPASDVPEGARCQRPACRSRWLQA
jgi:hypothetical protein